MLQDRPFRNHEWASALSVILENVRKPSPYFRKLHFITRNEMGWFWILRMLRNIVSKNDRSLPVCPNEAKSCHGGQCWCPHEVVDVVCRGGGVLVEFSECGVDEFPFLFCIYCDFVFFSFSNNKDLMCKVYTNKHWCILFVHWRRISLGEIWLFHFTRPLSSWNGVVQVSYRACILQQCARIRSNIINCTILFFARRD